MKFSLKGFLFLSLSVISLLSFSFISCNKSYDLEESTAQVDEILLNGKDAFTELENAFSNHKIVFVGSCNHNMINDHNFLNREHVESLRKQGLKYILVEGGGENLIYDEETLRDDWATPFYPWHNVDVQYDANNIRKVVADVNEGLSPSNQIVIVGLETGRKNFGSWVEDKEVFNYRDSYMADIAKDFIEISEDDEKILIYAGGAHGVKKEVKYGGSRGFKWKPLGAYLEEEYKEDFASYMYFSLSGVFEPYFIGGVALPGENIKQKFLTVKEGQNLQGVIHFVNDKVLYNCDGFFIDKNTEYGIKFGYKMSSPKIRKAIVEKAIELDEYIRSFKGVYDYTNADFYYAVSDFLRCIYYIDLHYGEQFNYSFWNPKTKCRDALKALDLKYEGHNNQTNIELVEYQLYIGSLMNRLSSLTNKAQAKKYYEDNIEIIEKARNIYPDDVWSDYYLAVINYKMENWEESLKYCDYFINNRISLCSQVFPDINWLAVENCENMDEDPGFYRKMLARTNNEYNLEIDYFSLLEL